MADLSIEIPVGMDISQVNAALKKFGGDIQQTAEYLNELTKSAGKGSTRQIGVQFIGKDSASPAFKAVETSANRSDKAVQGLSRTLKQQTKTQKGSVTALKQGLAARKQELAGLNKLDSRYKHVQQQIKGYQNALNKAQGIEKGSIAAKRQLLANLQRQADALVQGSAEQRRFTQEIRKLTAEINGTNGPFSAFFKTLNKLATLQAGFQAFTAIVGGFFGKINEFVGQAKQLEGFELALRNVGLSTIEASQALGEAAAISARLGAPLQQVEKSFKRMVPSLRAVGVNAEDSSKFIEGIAARTQTLGLNTEQSGRFVEAFAQVLSKGKLQAEELNQQISELDGAFRTQLADALGVTTSELEDLISNGEVTAEVFVKAFSEMENGAEELAKRVEEGNLTVQQFQNVIDKIRIENIRNLGSLLQPAIKGFLQLQLASEQFIAALIDSEFGKFLVDVFNNVVLGIRDFTTVVIDATKVLNFFLEPLFAITRAFSPLLRLIVPLAAGFATLKVATLAYGASATFASNTLVPFVAGLIQTSIQATIATAATIKLAAVNFAKSIAGWSVALFEFIKTLVLTRGNLVAAGTELKVYTALQGKAGAGALATAGKFALVGGAIAVAALAFSSFQDGASKGREAVAGLEVGIKDMEQTLKNNAVEIQNNIDLLTHLKNLVPGLSLFSGLGQSKEVNERVLQPMQRSMKAINERIEEFKSEFPALIGAGDDDLKAMRQSIKSYVDQAQVFLDNADKLHAGALAEGNVVLAQTITEVAIAIHESLGPQREQLEAIEEEIGKRKNLKKEIDNTIMSLDEFNKKRKEEQEQQDTTMLALEVNLLRQYGDTVTETADRTLVLAAAQAERHKGNVKRLKEELKLTQSKDDKEFASADEKRKLVEATTRAILEEEKKAIESNKAFADAITAEVERVFQQSTDAAQNYANISSQIASSIDKVRSNISSTVSTLRSAANIVFDNLSAGTGSVTKTKEIERTRLRFLARVNQIENTIAQAKLRSAFQLQQIEIQTLQTKLQGQAILAQREGDAQGAANLRKNIAGLDEVLKLNKLSYQIESRNLDLQKRMKDEQLVQQALSTKIGDQEFQLFSQHTNRKIAIRETNKALGTQRLTLGDIRTALSEMSTYSKDLESFDAKALSSGQNALATQEGAMESVNTRLEEMSDNYVVAIESNKDLISGLVDTNIAMTALTKEAQGYTKALSDAVATAGQLRGILDGGQAARWMGGPVEGGQTYRVNDAGLGREAFMNKFGNISLLPAGSNINWTAPSSGTIIPAAIVKQLNRNTEYNSRIANSNAKTAPTRSATLNQNGGMDSGNLVKQMTAALSGSGGNQRITNNVTIQSQQPVTDASQIMTNVARMRLRNGRRI
jgi:tape measure domain-containing protein